MAAVPQRLGHEVLGLIPREAMREGGSQRDIREARERAGPSALVVSACLAYLPLPETVP